MKVAIVGANGMLGTDLSSLLGEQDVNFTSLDIEEIDITDRKRVFDVLSPINPEIIINCAAYTDVENAEDEEDLAFAVNHIGAKNLAEFASEHDSTLCHLSTDYVFDGNKREPYKEEDETNPLGVYGKSKLAGEEKVRQIEKHYIIRTAWLYGLNGKNFITTVIKASQINDELKIVDDQYGAPTYTVDLAKRIMEVVTHLPYGTYHATNAGVATWFDVALETLSLLKIQTPLIPISSEEYPSKVVRPKYSILSNEASLRAGLEPMPEWQDALKRFISTLE